MALPRRPDTIRPSARRSGAAPDTPRRQIPGGAGGVTQRGISGKYASATSRNALRADWLFSYQPTPGTVFFAGYGSSLEEPHALRFGRGLRRTSDGFFVKFSYLFRV